MNRASVWLLDSRQADAPPPARWLSESETVRYLRFVRPARQRQFLLGRMLARQAIGALLGIDAHAVVLEERTGLAPALASPVAPRLGLSISHSGPWVACAVSADNNLGLDIEVRDAQRDLTALAEHAFPAQQSEALGRLAPAERLARFYALWCAQEAQIKLGGEGAPCVHLDHPELAIALCSTHKLDAIDIKLSG